MITSREKRIRKDLFALRVWTADGWCYQYITRDKDDAVGRRDFMKRDLSREFPLMDPQVVHPSQSIVDYYINVGNYVR